MVSCGFTEGLEYLISKERGRHAEPFEICIYAGSMTGRVEFAISSSVNQADWQMLDSAISL